MEPGQTKQSIEMQTQNATYQTQYCPVEKIKLRQYVRIPTAFEVSSILKVELIDNGIGGIRFVEEPVPKPYIKNYDLIDNPLGWTNMFFMANWRMIIAYDRELPVGGAIVLWRDQGVSMLEGRSDLALLWDIRVMPDYRRSGVGRTLFAEAAKWARERDCKQLKIETQNTNVAACRFYAKMGCKLGQMNRYAYQDQSVQHETMLCWYFDL